MGKFNVYHKPSLKEAAQRKKEEVEVIRNSVVIDDDILRIFHKKKFLVRTFGCQANLRDGEIIKGILQKMGCIECNDTQEADIILLNTCAIRENAEDRVFGEIGSLKGLKRMNPNLIIGICGCMVQQDSVVDEIISTYHQVDLVFGTHNLVHLPKLLKDVTLDGNRVLEVFSKEGDIYEDLPSIRDDKKKAWVNIMYGCDKFCTYCIVPYTRGKQRSRNSKDILNEVKELIALGYLEVTLLGQNVNAYGKDLQDECDFASLLEQVAQTKISQIRFVTSHPWDFSDQMIDIMAKYTNIMPQIHLPLQSGDNEILRKMGRRYTFEHYFALYTKLRDRLPGCAITTDIIVGFPNESDEQFENTMKAVELCKFDGAFTFIFSPRPSTPAAEMEDTISDEIKKERFQRLLSAVANHGKYRNDQYIGKTVKVLVDGVSKKNDNILSGYSESWKLVNFSGDPSMIGRIVDVKIERAKSFTLEGCVVNAE